MPRDHKTGIRKALDGWHAKQDKDRLKKPSAPRGKPEQEEQRLLVQWARENGIYTILTQAEQLGKHEIGSISRIQSHRRSLGQTKGQPDLVLLVPGLGPVVCEMKAPRGSMTPEQKVLQKFCIDNNIHHVWGTFEKVSQAIVAKLKVTKVVGTSY